MIGMMLTALVVFMIATFPATWLLMLFLGNVGVNVSNTPSSVRSVWRLFMFTSYSPDQ